MGRVKGGINKQNYKYLMSVYGGEYQYFRSYCEIWTKYPDLNKSAITNIIFNPERMLNNKKYKIIKLTNYVPVFLKTRQLDAHGNWVTSLNPIDYTSMLRQLGDDRSVVSVTAPPLGVHEALSDHT
jgi:hypothetical protein